MGQDVLNLHTNSCVVKIYNYLRKFHMQAPHNEVDSYRLRSLVHEGCRSLHSGTDSDCRGLDYIKIGKNECNQKINEQFDSIISLNVIYNTFFSRAKVYVSLVLLTWGIIRKPLSVVIAFILSAKNQTFFGNTTIHAATLSRFCVTF